MISLLRISFSLPIPSHAHPPKAASRSGSAQWQARTCSRDRTSDLSQRDRFRNAPRRARGQQVCFTALCLSSRRVWWVVQSALPPALCAWWWARVARPTAFARVIYGTSFWLPRETENYFGRTDFADDLGPTGSLGLCLFGWMPRHEGVGDSRILQREKMERQHAMVQTNRHRGYCVYGKIVPCVF